MRKFKVTINRYSEPQSQGVIRARSLAAAITKLSSALLEDMPFGVPCELRIEEVPPNHACSIKNWRN